MYTVININDVINLRGEEAAQSLISTFSCSNKEVETFIRFKSVEFAKRKLAVTYLVYAEEIQLAGAFTLANKYAAIPAETLSNSQKSKIRPFAVYDEGESAYVASAYLLAQFGKNKDESEDCPITGTELMTIVIDTVSDIQKRIGGRILWLECEEDNIKALRFYNKEPAKFFRYSKRDSAEAIYVQMLKLL